MASSDGSQSERRRSAASAAFVPTPLSVAQPRPDLPEPTGDLQFLVTRRGAVAVRTGTDGALRLAPLPHDPRDSEHTAAEHIAAVVGERHGAVVLAVELDAAPAADGTAGGTAPELMDLRAAAPLLPAEDVQIAAAAVAIGAWHRVTRFCPACGGRLRAREDGWALVCETEGTVHFPRTDPVVIMAVRDDRDRLLLAESVRAHGAFISVLAGFIEAGESAEAAVRRETREEAGLEVMDVEYVGSQPWPFPRSLMLGFRAHVAAPEPVRVQAEELRWARWFTRTQLRAALAAGSTALPGPSSLGRALIEDWLREDGAS